MASILVPVAYVVLVFGSLFVFSHFYRKRLASQPFEPYFPPHIERNTYVTLLQKSDPPTPEPILKAALVRRAVADVLRVLKVREDKPALQNLLQKGSIGDDLWNSLLAAEKELEGEVSEVIAEAESYLPRWGELIFQTANEIIANDRIRASFEQINQNKAKLEIKYGVKAKLTLGVGPPPPGAVTTSGSTPPSNAPSPSPSSLLTPSKPANGTSNTPPNNGALQPPVTSSSADSIASSDGEGKSPSKNAKKAKKRK